MMEVIKLKKNQILEKSNGFIKTFAYVKKVHKNDVYTLVDYFTKKFICKDHVDIILKDYKLTSNKFKIKIRR